MVRLLARAAAIPLLEAPLARYLPDVPLPAEPITGDETRPIANDSPVVAVTTLYDEE